MNTKKLIALILALTFILCALPVAYAAASDPATGDDTDIDVGVEDLPDTAVVYGDADGNGEIDNYDATLIRQYNFGWDVSIDLAAADADGNGEIDNYDATLIRQYNFGWDVVLGPQQ